MASGLWIRQGDQVQGPFPTDKVLEWVIAGKIRPEMMLSRDGAEWHPADTALRVLLADDEPPAPPPPPASAGLSRRTPRGTVEPASSVDRLARSRVPARAKPEPRVGAPAILAALLLAATAGAVGVFLMARSGDSKSGGSSSAKAPAPEWWPTSTGATLGDWERAISLAPPLSTEALAESGRRIRAARLAKPLVEAATLVRRRPNYPPWLDEVVHAADGSSWRARPELRRARWKAFDAYTQLERLATGAYVPDADLARIDAEAERIAAYEAALANDPAAREADLVRSVADPENVGFLLEKKEDGILWLAAKSKTPPPADRAVASIEEARARIGTILKAAWPFAAKAPLAEALKDRVAVVVLSTQSTRYEGRGAETQKFAGPFTVPIGSSVSWRLRCARVAVATARDVAIACGVERPRDRMRFPLAFRWGYALADYDADLQPLLLPFSRDRSRDGLRTVLGRDPSAPRLGTMLAMAAEENPHEIEERIGDLDEERRAAMEFLAYRFLLRPPGYEGWPLPASFTGPQMELARDDEPMVVEGFLKPIRWSSLVAAFQGDMGPAHSEGSPKDDLATIVDLARRFPGYVTLVARGEIR